MCEGTPCVGTMFCVCVCYFWSHQNKVEVYVDMVLVNVGMCKLLNAHMWHAGHVTVCQSLL